MLAPLAPLLSGPLALPALTGLAALPCSLCYVRQAYVFSLSYGLATATIGTAILAALPATAQVQPGHAFFPCLLYTSPSPRDGLLSRMPSSA